MIRRERRKQDCVSRRSRTAKTVAFAQTDQAGQFALANMSGGVYELQTPASSGVYRLWAPRTAPPAAEEGVLLVTGDGVQLGQKGYCDEKSPSAFGFLANPWVLAGIVAAAIAIPLAVSSNDDDNS